MNTRKPFLGLLHRRQCLLPTWRGWLLLVLVFGVTGMFVLRGLYGFLAIRDPLPGGILVVEGWSPDYVMDNAVEEFRRDGHRMICVTGGPIEFGNLLSEYRTYAECGRALLLKLGVPGEAIHAVPAAAVERDRTYASGIALKRWLEQQGAAERTISIVGNGPHSRRTRLLYEKALGPDFRVGISNVDEKGFDPKAWWKTSQGVRVMIDETVAYAYARFVFSPPKPQP